jgi:hypothetical protein
MSDICGITFCDNSSNHDRIWNTEENSISNTVQRSKLFRGLIVKLYITTLPSGCIFAAVIFIVDIYVSLKFRVL